MAPRFGCWYQLFGIQKRKSVEPFCHSFHRVKALALPSLSKRATLKAPRRCKYIIPFPTNRHGKCLKLKRAVYNTSQRAFPLLCFWQTDELLDSYTVKTKAYKNAFNRNVCLPTSRSIWGFQQERRRKDTWIFLWRRMFCRFSSCLAIFLTAYEA